MTVGSTPETRSDDLAGGSARRRPTNRLMLTVVVLALVGHLLLYLGVIVDDAYISFRYARNLSEGLGLVYNVGERVEGYTNFLWVVIAAAGFVLGAAPTLLIPPLGALSAVALVLYTQHSARVLASESKEDGRVVDLQPPWAAVILAGSVGVAFYSVTGLETVFYTWLVTIGVVSAARQRATAFACATALAFLTRPEAGLLALLGLGWLLLARGLASEHARGLARRNALRAAALLAALLLPYLVFKLAYFGELLPNTLQAKRPSLGHGLRYVLEGLTPAAGLVALVLFQLTRFATTPPAITFIGLYWLAATLSVGFTGGDWMWAERMLVPALPALALCVDHFARTRRSAPARALLVVSLLGYLGVSAYQSRELSTLFASYMDADAAYADFARELQAQQVESLVAADIGMLGYVARDVQIVDLIGLVDRTIARAPGGHGDKQLPLDYLAKRDPQLVVIESEQPAQQLQGGLVAIAPRQPSGQRLLHSAWLRENYRLTRSVQAAYLWLHIYEKRPAASKP